MESLCSDFPKKFVVIFDVDGHLIDTESLGYQAYYEVIKEYLINNEKPNALRKFEVEFAPENGGMNWFVENMMGKSHQLVSKLIYKEFILLDDRNDIYLEAMDSYPSSNFNSRAYTAFAKQIYREKRDNFQFEMAKIRKEVDKRVIERTDESSLLLGAKEMLTRLNANKNVSVHFVSGSSRERLKQIFTKTGLIDLIDFEHNVRGGEDFKYKTQALEQIQKQEGSQHNRDILLPSSHMIFSGDSIYDAMSSEQSHIYFIGNVAASHCANCKTEHSQRLIENGADVVVSTMVALKQNIINRILDVRSKEERAIQMLNNVSARDKVNVIG